MVLLRRVAIFLLLPSLIAFAIGIANLGGALEMSGFVLESGYVVLGSVLLAAGSGLLLWGDSTGRLNMVVLGVLLMLVGGVTIVGLMQPA